MAAISIIRPPGFSWVVPGLLGGLAWPSQPEHFLFLRSEGVKYLVSLTEMMPPGADKVEGLQSIMMSIVDFHPPEIKQIQEFMELVQKCMDQKETLAVHCRVGHGRTGTILACYFVKFEGMSASDAIVEIRNRRPGSIETKPQEDRVHEYEVFLKNK